MWKELSLRLRTSPPSTFSCSHAQGIKCTRSNRHPFRHTHINTHNFFDFLLPYLSLCTTLTVIVLFSHFCASVSIKLAVEHGVRSGGILVIEWHMIMTYNAIKRLSPPGLGRQDGRSKASRMDISTCMRLLLPAGSILALAPLHLSLCVMNWERKGREFFFNFHLPSRSYLFYQIFTSMIYFHPALLPSFSPISSPSTDPALVSPCLSDIFPFK